ncbi:universal stress protein [Bradyrhizobium sp.]|uniref:universal stress protein n=1 Tax=Bradyrhizobium sp. TaxID=376 RepID=UPI00260C8965|nr:universal stress protein [Bradyrhizobium sp.]
MLVHIPTERSARPAVDGSVSLAMLCGAHLEAVATGFESVNVPFLAEGGAAVASFVQLDYERAMERAQVALSVFETEANGAELSYNSHALAGTFGEVVATVAAMARLHDLMVVSQGETDGDVRDNRLLQELLLQTGGPLLVFPYTFRGAFKATRIGICWDGSRLAARALHDAMPLLHQADTLMTITLNASELPAEASPAELPKYLARHGLSASTISLKADRAEVQSSILAIAADESLDLLVMGGYGHARMQETVFGGVTREMFRSMTIPVLMSH